MYFRTYSVWSYGESVQTEFLVFFLCLCWTWRFCFSFLVYFKQCSLTLPWQIFLINKEVRNTICYIVFKNANVTHSRFSSFIFLTCIFQSRFFAGLQVMKSYKRTEGKVVNIKGWFMCNFPLLKQVLSVNLAASFFLYLPSFLKTMDGKPLKSI